MIFCDVETTGVDPCRNEIITASFIATDEALSKTHELDLKFRPAFPKQWTKEAEKVHGISLEEAMTFPKRKDSMQEMMNFFSMNLQSKFVCHAAYIFGQHFDWSFIKMACFDWKMQYVLFKSFRDQDVISTITEVKKKHTFENYKLDTICKNFSIALNHHDAKSDVNACYEIYKKVNL